MEDNKGLGDIVENIIQTILPKTADNLKDCVGCKKRKQWLNNTGAIFSNKKNESI